MSQMASTSTASSRFQTIFNAAVQSYERQTKRDLIAHPLASQLQLCESTSDIITLLQSQVRDFDQTRSGDERLTKWLNPTVNVLGAFSAAVSGGVSLAFSPASTIFAGIGVFLLAAKDVAASKDVLAELFERIGFFFKRLETYTEVTPTAAMTDIIIKIMVEVLTIFGIATKELKRGSTKKFLKRLAGRTDLEDAIQRLDTLTQEEARMALAEVLRVTHSVHDGVKVVDGKVADVGDKVECVGEKLQLVIDDGKEACVTAKEAKLMIQQTANGVCEIMWNQLIQLLRTWLSPSDPSTNHNIARKVQHKGTAAWFFQGDIYIEWKSTGSLLWIHGKAGSGKSIICSSVIEDITVLCEARSAVLAYFYFDFRDLNKQSCHDLLLSLVSQISSSSSRCCDILHRVHARLQNGARQPSDDTLKECLKEMLRLPGQGQVFIILDALDECPDSSGIPSPRSEVLQFVQELVDLDLKELHICATSRPEVDIRAVLEPLAFRSVSLHDQGGQKADIADYVRNVVNSSPSAAMRRWRDDDKNLVIETLIERADGMFRWVFCQLDVLRHCFPPNLRQFLDELPDTLDETYERMLRGISKAQQDNAHRLLQCLAVAVRPLRVEELAELLAFDFHTSNTGGIPTLKEDWRWDDEEQAVLSTCSSLIIIVRDPGGSRVVQFSHFSVKEYLTSPRLAPSRGDVSLFYIHLQRAHTILAQACLGTLLRLDEHTGDSGCKGFPLVEYAAEHWVEHARFEEVSSRVRDGMDDLFDISKPHFAAWLHVHDLDESWYYFSPFDGHHGGSPLYYAAFCGLYDLAERLIKKHPEQVNAIGGRNLAPLPAALYKKHFHVADLLHKHGAAVDVRGIKERTSLHVASAYGQIDTMLWMLDHGADVNPRQDDLWTPLHQAALNLQNEAIHVLLDHNVDVNLQNDDGDTPLSQFVFYISFRSGERTTADSDVVRRLLERGADPNACDRKLSTPLHQASFQRWIEVVGLLLSYGAKVDERDIGGSTPFQFASSNGHHEMMKLLSDHGAKPEP